MQVQTILHAASTLLGLGDGAVKQGPADGKLLITSKMASKGKKTPQDEPALAEKMLHCGPRYSQLNGNDVTLQKNTRHVSNLKNMNDDKWI